ncbi:type VI secretion system tip protein TssI/VgrG [Collimonas pratensis]|uniref:Rhs element Vgr family protein n=1 Tax=Collimonas pratensis TaxID=279113 RepID=A0A127Q3P0_9BURK|nr:type VI secretion system tip protein TssI/VgrG [Collimonas pratensis]AMP04700.1 rhs element Vgr family protein [Collimonas pratensis]
MSFASNGNGGGSGLSLPSASGMLGQVAGLAGTFGSGTAAAQVLGQASQAAQLAQTAASLLGGKTPATIADAINSLTGSSGKLTQQGRIIRLESPFGEDALLVNTMIADEHVNDLFHVALDMMSYSPDLNGKDIVGKPVLLRLLISKDGPGLGNVLTGAGDEVPPKERFFHGYVSRFGRVGDSGSVTRYTADVKPWLWFLDRSKDSRIFIGKTPEEILKEVFDGYGFRDVEFHLQSEYEKFEYIVQYRESDFNFVSRLMEQEGLAYWFRHEEDKHVLVISDNNDFFSEMKGFKSIDYYGTAAAAQRDSIEQWDEAFQYRVGKMTFRDFNYETPSTPLLHVEVPTTLQHSQITNTEHYDYHSLYDSRAQGERYATFAMQAEEVRAHEFTGGGYARAMVAGGKFKLVNHKTSTYNDKEFALLSVKHEAANDYTQHQGQLAYRNTFTALPVDIPYRPVKVTPKPFVQGTHTAIVVGPKGEEIHVDKQGRVPIHFHWDRQGKMDGKDTIFVRVSQPMAGQGWGGGATPRIGQEVIVGYIEGDPDNPIIIGRVYNGEAQNPYGGSFGETMGIRSKTHKGGGFNELKMVDTNGAEQLALQAQRDMHVKVKNNQSTTVHADKSTYVGGGHTENIKKDVAITVAEGGYDLTVNDKHMHVTAKTEIKLVVGDNSITIDQNGITIKGLKIASTATAENLILGEPVNINPAPPPPTPEQALAAQWAAQTAIIDEGLRSQNPAVRAAAQKLQASRKAQQMALLAGAVYDPTKPPPPGWKSSTNDPAALAPYGLKPSDFKIAGTNFGAQMYTPDPAVFGDSLKPTIAMKGTQKLAPWSDDMENNFAQGINGESSYYKRAVDMGTKIDRAGMAGSIDGTGHSLGGGTISAFSQASGASATTFNAAGLNPETVAHYGGVVHPSQITAYRVDGEVLTGLQEPTVMDHITSPTTSLIGDMMPKAVGTPVTMEPTSFDPVRRHMMSDVNNGIGQIVQQDQSTLTGLLGMN